MHVNDLAIENCLLLFLFNFMLNLKLYLIPEEACRLTQIVFIKYFLNLDFKNGCSFDRAFNLNITCKISEKTPFCFYALVEL